MNDRKVIEHIINDVLDRECFMVQGDNFSDINEDDRRELEDNKLKMCTLKDAIIKMLPEEGKELYRTLEDLEANNLAIGEKYMFKKGVIVGLTDLEYLKKAGTCIYLPALKI